MSDSLVIGKWSSSVILEYYQIVEGKRPDLHLYNRARKGAVIFYNNWLQGIPYEENLKKILDNEMDLMCKEIHTRNVYMIEYDPSFETQFEFVPKGDFFELRLKEGQCTTQG